MMTTTATISSAPNSVQLLDTLTAAVIKRLSLPRPLSPQVSNALADNYTVSESEYEVFFAEKLNTLDDYEIDLVFSPQFTPKPADYDAACAVLGTQQLIASEFTALLVAVLNELPAVQMILPSGATVGLPLHEVMVQRFLKLLFLTESVPAVLSETLQTCTFPAAILARLTYCVRQSIYKLDKYAQFFALLLKHFSQKADMTLEKTLFVHEFIQTYKPAALDEMIRQLNALIASCEVDMVTAVERSYHHEEIKMGSAGSDDDFNEAETIRISYRNTIRLCQLIKADLAL
ncbi:MAG: hypothetical protein H2174_02505 [Vampirovibrio sp.]|nr:hypothetical protein [Vampirovibrio sp.]